MPPLAHGACDRGRSIEDGFDEPAFDNQAGKQSIEPSFEYGKWDVADDGDRGQSEQGRAQSRYIVEGNARHIKENGKTKLVGRRWAYSIKDEFLEAAKHPSEHFIHGCLGIGQALLNEKVETVKFELHVRKLPINQRQPRLTAVSLQ